MANEIVAELKVKGKSDLTMSIDLESTDSYYTITNGNYSRTFPKTTMGQADAMIAYERGIWERMNTIDNLCKS